jgi:serine protease AprX
MGMRNKLTAVGFLTISLSLCFLGCKSNTPPVADFSAAPRSGGVPLTVAFTDESDPGSSGFISWWDWDFGDGSTSINQQPSYTYDATGQYTVTLIVGNPSGTDTMIKEDYINVQSPPIANFAGAPTSGPAPLQVEFQDRSADGSLPITTWSWTFGDGSVSSERNPSHMYWMPGTYTVSLTVGNSLGNDTQIREDYIEAQ